MIKNNLNSFSYRNKLKKFKVILTELKKKNKKFKEKIKNCKI